MLAIRQLWRTRMAKVCWFDLPVQDVERSQAFFSRVFGWKFEPMFEGYFMILDGESTIGGLRVETGKTGETNAPVLYFDVPTLNQGIALLKEAEAALIGDVIDIGEDGCFQLFQDPDKNLLAIWAGSRD